MKREWYKVEVTDTFGGPFRYAVVCAYSGPFGDRGAVLSRHRTYDAAVRAMNRRGDGGWLKVREL